MKPDGTFGCDLPEKAKSVKEVKTDKNQHSESINNLQSKLESLKKDSQKGIKKIHKVDGSTIDVESSIQQIQKQIDKLSKKTGNNKSNIKKTDVTEATPQSEQLVKTKSVIEKVKKEKASGKVSKETYKQLRNSVNELRSLTKVNSSKSDVKNKSVTEKSKKEKESGKSIKESPEIKKELGNIIKSYNKITDKSYNVLSNNSDGYQAIEAYIADSHVLTDILIENNNIKLDEYPRRYGRIVKQIKALDDTFNQSKLETPIVVSSGVSKLLYEKISKDGTEFSIPTYISTSIDDSVSDQYANLARTRYSYQNNINLHDEYVIEFKLPEGTPVIATDKYIQNHETLKNEKWIYADDSGSQKEVILNRGLKYKVISQTSQPKKGDEDITYHKLIVEVIK